MLYGPSDVPFRVGTSSIGPHGTSGKGKGGKGDGKGKVNVSSYYSEGKGGKCDDWMRTLWNQEFTRVPLHARPRVSTPPRLFWLE